VTVRLPLRRLPTTSYDPQPSSGTVLPEVSEARPEGGFGKEAFLRALVVQMAQAVEAVGGPELAERAVAQVGTDVGGQMEREYRHARDVVGLLSPEQVADCLVRLKAAIDGGFHVVEVSADRIVLTNTRCPFGPVVQHAPALCRMTSSVFGGIAARNSPAVARRSRWRSASPSATRTAASWCTWARRRGRSPLRPLLPAARARRRRRLTRAGHRPPGVS
jgi:hypothetical protein